MSNPAGALHGGGTPRYGPPHFRGTRPNPVRVTEILSLGPDPRVLVVAADDDLAGPLCAGLDALGWRTLTARTLESGAAAMEDLAFEAALIADAAPDAAAVLKARALPRILPVLALSKPGRDDQYARIGSQTQILHHARRIRARPVPVSTGPGSAGCAAGRGP